ncbi:GAF domain-containing protein [Deinococcus sp. Arct2-2]|uniref:GAF domain-containing protein n=1 Tax=Deinococcus sp. Arct2-2 TaxID=2568653 RepID=UPI0010A36B63|nr:GAF domain-containing protein [Deinococcus sp. Arct2-2]THF67706.1 GAF domain-containing protein [Deinococcus sp. Arct2-2]
MSDDHPQRWNVYENVVTGATPNPLMTDPDELDEAFARGANRVLEGTVQLARVLIGAHQSAAAIVVQGDWTSVRKFFSLSEKYAEWKNYRVAATGYGLHGWLLREPQTLRLTQGELEAHPQWRNFGTEAGHHPPLRGWLATPIQGQDGTVWGLLQLSDKMEGDFDAADTAHLEQLAEVVSTALDALWAVRNLQKAAQGAESMSEVEPDC